MRARAHLYSCSPFSLSLSLSLCSLLFSFSVVTAIQYSTTKSNELIEKKNALKKEYLKAANTECTLIVILALKTHKGGSTSLFRAFESLNPTLDKRILVSTISAQRA